MREADQILLVLTGHEAAGHRLEQAEGDGDQRHIDPHHEELAGNHALDAAAIGLRAAMEERVEPLEEPAEALVHHLCQSVLRCVVRFQQERRERGRQRQRVERGDHGRDRNRQCELLVELAGEAADEGQRHEHRDQHERDGDDRSRHLVHGLIARLDRREASLDIALDVLDHDDGVVHHDADGENEPEQRQRVDGKTHHEQHGKGADDRHRNGDQRNNRRAPRLQEQDDDQNHQRHRFEQRVNHGLDGGADELGRVIDDAVVHAVRHVLFQLRHGLADAVGNLDRVRAGGLEDRNGHGRFVVQQ